MPTPEQTAARLGRRADRASLSFSRALARVWRDAERRLQRLLSAVPDTVTGELRATQLSSLRQQMRQTLREAGYDALIESATDAPLTAIVETWLRAHPETEIRVVGPRIEGLRALHQLDLLDEGDRAVSALWDAAMRGLFLRKPVADILDDLSAVIDRTDAQIATLYDTTVSIFTRQLELLDSDDDPNTRYLYTGPDDDKTRPFCDRLVGQTFTRAEIQAMDNGQMDNVLLSGGGYNCRHLWLQVSRFA